MHQSKIEKHGLRITFAREVSDSHTSYSHPNIPLAWRRGSMHSSLTSLHLMYKSAAITASMRQRKQVSNRID